MLAFSDFLTTPSHSRKVLLAVNLYYAWGLSSLEAPDASAITLVIIYQTE